MMQPKFGRLAEGGARPAVGEECFLELLGAPGGPRVERILSRGASSPQDFWYEQGWDEFVLLVSGAAVLAFADGSERRLEAGDYAILPALCRHRVAWTDPAGETLWLAVHLPCGAGGIQLADPRAESGLLRAPAGAAALHGAAAGSCVRSSCDEPPRSQQARG